MRVLITDTAFVWNYKNPFLKKFKNVLTVVCLEGKAVTDEYECFVSPYEPVSLGNADIGINDMQYKALESVGDELNRSLHYHDDILFLTDWDPRSLYPYYVIKDRNKHNSLHLCTVSPWRFEGKRRIDGHNTLLSDLSKLTSILYIDSNKYLDNASENDTFDDVMKRLEKDYTKLLPTVVNSIGSLHGEHYFNFSTNSYVPVKDGFYEIDGVKKAGLDSWAKVRVNEWFCTLGIIIPPIYPNDGDITKDEVEIVPARVDGKKICKYLREQRIVLAKANGIEFSSPECPSIGPCGGTCAKCDEEAAYLRNQLYAIKPEDRVIPDFTLDEWEVEA